MFGFQILVICLHYLVDFLLFMGTNRLCGYPGVMVRCAFGAAVTTLQATACLIPGFHFLRNFLWRMIFAVIGAAVAFGAHKSSLRRCAVYLLLRLVVAGAVGTGVRALLGMIVAGTAVVFLGGLGINNGRRQQFVPVQLRYGGKVIKITALLDTGNTLYDPVSGQSVLVVGADAAQLLTGLTREQLRKPVESIGTLPGLRLIPYKTIGTDCGFMLGLRLMQVQIGSQRGSRVVAFAPQQLSSQYQALTGGVL